MLNRIISRLTRAQGADAPGQQEEQIADDFLIAQAGHDLLERPSCTVLIRQIRDALGPGEAAWNRHYLYALSSVAAFCQIFPASRTYHHTADFGLLEHTLEVAARAVRISKGSILPPDAPPEDLILQGDRWRFGILIAALLHDLGKVISDVEVAYLCPDREQFVDWNPMAGPMPGGAKYLWRHTVTKGKPGTRNGLHELYGATLLPFLLTPESFKWLRADPELMKSMLCAITASGSGHPIIPDIVRAADQRSVGKAVTLAETKGESTALLPLHERVMTTLKELANNGGLKINEPGAAVFVTEEATWVTKGGGLEAVLKHLRDQNPQGVPQSSDRVAQELHKNGCSMDGPNSHHVMQAVISLEDEKWEQKLTCLKFDNSVIWDRAPPLLSGTVRLFGEKPKKQATPKTDPKRAPIAEPPPPPDAPDPEAPVSGPEETPQVENPNPTTAGDGATSADAPPPPPPPAPPSPKQIQRARKQLFQKNAALTARSPFFNWLLDGLASYAIRANEPRGLVHIVDDFVAIVTPAAFDRFVDDREGLTGDVTTDKIGRIRAIQKQTKALRLHVKASDGSDFHRIFIDGKRKKTAVNCLLIPRSALPGLDHLSVNPVLRIPN